MDEELLQLIELLGDDAFRGFYWYLICEWSLQMTYYFLLAWAARSVWPEFKRWMTRK